MTIKPATDYGITFPIQCKCSKCEREWSITEILDFSTEYEDSPTVFITCPRCNSKAYPIESGDCLKLYKMVEDALAACRVVVGPRIITGVSLKRPVRTYCCICISTVELTTLDGISRDTVSDKYYFRCPKCTSRVYINQGPDTRIIIEALLGF